MTFRIEVIETYSKFIEVDAVDLLEALSYAQEKYDKSEMILDSSNYVDTEFRCSDSI